MEGMSLGGELVLVSACLTVTPPITGGQEHTHNMGGFQREDDAAKWQQWNGIARARVERVPRDTQFFPNPSNGGSRGYDVPFRQMIVGAYQAGNPTPNGILRSIALSLLLNLEAA
jgi:hypothetical protein